MTEPATMNAARRGNNTDQFSIHIVWDQLEGDSIRGGYITSYYLQWDKGTNGTNWYDLVGLTEPYLQLEFTATFGDVDPGTNYQVRLKAENAFGFSVNWSSIATITSSSEPDLI